VFIHVFVQIQKKAMSEVTMTPSLGHDTASHRNRSSLRACRCYNAVLNVSVIICALCTSILIAFLACTSLLVHCRLAARVSGAFGVSNMGKMFTLYAFIYVYNIIYIYIYFDFKYKHTNLCHRNAKADRLTGHRVEPMRLTTLQHCILL